MDFVVVAIGQTVAARGMGQNASASADDLDDPAMTTGWTIYYYYYYYY